MEFVIAYSFLHSAHWLIKFMTVLLHISFTIFYIEFWQFSDLLLFDSSSYIENCHSLLQEDSKKTILLENQQKNYTSVIDTLVFDLENPENEQSSSILRGPKSDCWCPITHPIITPSSNQ